MTETDVHCIIQFSGTAPGIGAIVNAAKVGLLENGLLFDLVTAWNGVTETPTGYRVSIVSPQKYPLPKIQAAVQQGFDQSGFRYSKPISVYYHPLPA